jgi:autotransporter-associated beta strand protein
LNVTGVISGGNANTILRLNSNTGGDTTTSYRLAGNNTMAGIVELYRGAVVITNANSLGTARLQLNGNGNSTLGDVRFESSVTLTNEIDLFNTFNADPIHTGGNTVSLNGVIRSTGTFPLVKIGAGTLALGATNTYTTGTTVNAGTLLVSGSIAGGATTVNAGAIFGGTGTAGAVTVNATATITPGATVSNASAIGNLNATSLTTVGAATFELGINTTTTTGDTLTLSGALNLALGNTTVLSITDLAPMALGNGVFPFITYSSYNTGLFTVGGNVIPDDGTFTVGVNTFALDYNYNGNSVALIVVPEPESFAAVAGGFAMLAALRGRRRLIR